jgi:hypothetical protein
LRRRKMSDKYLKINSSTEYNKNGSVKAYQSIIYHIKLDKTVKVRNRDYSLYIQKFNDEKENLKKEYSVVKKNRDIRNFIEKAVKLHIFAYKESKVDYDKYVLSVINKELKSLPSEPQYDKIIEPIKPNKESEKYIFNAKWYHKLFGMIESKQKLLDSKMN